MLKQPNVGLRNADGDTDTLSIQNISPLSNIIPKIYKWDLLFKGEGGYWDTGEDAYLFQKTYKLPGFEWQRFYAKMKKPNKSKHV